MKKGDLLKYDITFEDKTKDYVIWASYKPFKNTGFPDDDTNCCKFFDSHGTELNKPTNCQRGYLITNGEGTIYTPEIAEDGYLCIKFGIYDSEKANIGGGVFKPVEIGVITKEA